MDNEIYSDNRSALVCGSGMAAFHYAREWANDAPEEMFAWLAKQNEEQSFYAYILFESWAGKDMKGALAAANRIPISKNRAQALISCLEVLNKSDPSRAKKLLAQNIELFSPAESSSLSWSYDPGNLCIEMVNSLPPSKERTCLLSNLLGDVCHSDEAKKVWKDLSMSERRELIDAGFDPYKGSDESLDGIEDLLRERIEATGDTNLAETFISKYGGDWVERDLAGALEWTQKHFKGHSRVEHREKLFQTGITKNFDQTIKIWKAMPEGFLKSSAAEAILRATPDTRKAEATTLLNTQEMDPFDQ
jgi:hypothetical protein